MSDTMDGIGPDDRDLQPIDRLGIAAAIASITAVGVALGLGLPLLSVILEQRGTSPTMIGVNTAVAGLASLLAAPLVTPIARRIGVHTTMLVSIVAAGLAAIGFYVFVPLWTWFPLRLVFHFAITAMFVLSEFWINAACPPGRRGLILGIYATVLAMGFALGPFLFSVVGSAGFLPFGIGAGVIFAAAIPLFLAWNREPKIESSSSGSFRRFIFAVPAATGAVLVFGAVESGGFALFPLYGHAHGFSEAGAARLLTVIGLGSVLMQIPIGLLSDRVPDRRWMLLAFALVGLTGALALPWLMESWWLVAATLFVWGGGVAGLYTVGLAHLGSRLSGTELAAANAAFIFCYSLGMLVGPQMIGGAMDTLGRDGFAYALALLFAAYLVPIGIRTARSARRS
ncbi:MFS transporter [Aureimonas pseudogalii]